METIGELIDKLITANIKIFWLEEELQELQKLRKPDVVDRELLENIADLDVKRRGTTTRRRMLINELDKRLGEKAPPDIRTV